MSTQYAGSSTSYAASVPVLSARDQVANSVYAPAFQTLADRMAYLKARMPIAYSAGKDGTEGVATAAFLYNPAKPPAIDGLHSGANRTDTTADVANGYIDIPSCGVGDKIQVRCSFAINAYNNGVTDLTNSFYGNLLVIEDNAGTPHYQFVPGAQHPTQGVCSTGVSRRYGASGATPWPTFMWKFAGLYTIANAGTARIAMAWEGAVGTAMWMHGFALTAVRYPAL